MYFCPDSFDARWLVVPSTNHKIPCGQLHAFFLTRGKRVCNC